MVRDAGKQKRAGMVIYRVLGEGQVTADNIEMLFMIPSNPDFGGPDPQLPKGRIDPGETPLQAALREAQEEVGLFYGSLMEPAYELGTFMGYTTVYVGRVDPNAEYADFTDEVKETVWMSPDQFMERGRIIHKPVVQAAVRSIIKHENERAAPLAARLLVEDNKYDIDSYQGDQ